MTHENKRLTVAPGNLGWVRCFGVIKARPWHLAGVYGARNAAEAAARSLGPQYNVAFGSHRLGSDDFIYEAPTA